MANTTGTINTVTVTGTDIVTDALQDLKVLLDGEAPSSGDPTKGIRKLNFWIKMIAIKGFLLWCRDLIQVPMVTNVYTYTIGPGGDVNTYRPLRALPGSFIRETCGVTSFNDVPLTTLSQLEYLQMSAKNTLGVPNSIFYDPQMAPSPFSAYDPSLSKGVLKVWTAPSDLTRTIFLYVQRPIQDVSAAASFDLPLEWYDCLTKNLAAQLSNSYEVPTDFRREVKAEAKDALETLSDWGAQEQAPTSFQPDWRWTTSMMGRG